MVIFPLAGSIIRSGESVRRKVIGVGYAAGMREPGNRNEDEKICP
jgi:hypothetical protein